MINPHEINFNIFIRRWTLEGARSYFEEFISEFLRIKYKYNSSIRTLRKNPGDWGIDVILGNLDNFNIIWQCKFFHDKLGTSQKAQIRGSYNDLLKNSREKGFKIYRWVLCIPIDLDPKEYKWWKKWKEKMEKQDNITISCIMLQDIKDKCSDPAFDRLFRKYFREERRIEIHPSFGDSEILAIEDSSLFIKHINKSDITTDIINLKRQFYTADYLEKDIEQKSSKYELDNLNHVYDELYSLWELGHNLIYSKRDTDDGNDLFNKIREEVIDKLEYFKGLIPNLGINSIIGLILKMSDRNKIYWTKENRLAMA